MSHEDRDYIAALRAKGYRVTMQRLIVLDAVCELAGHATIAAVQGKVSELDPSIDRSTVYRALEVLTEVGLVVRADLPGKGSIYTISGATSHHHLVCRSCGKIITLDRAEVQPLVQHVRAAHHFELEAEHLIFDGICHACMNSAR